MDHIVPTVALDYIIATMSSNHIIATMILHNIISFGTFVAFVIPQVALLSSTTVMWRERK
jgi:hypothetical protein